MKGGTRLGRLHAPPGGIDCGSRRTARGGRLEEDQAAEEGYGDGEHQACTRQPEGGRVAGLLVPGLDRCPGGLRGLIDIPDQLSSKLHEGIVTPFTPVVKWARRSL